VCRKLIDALKVGHGQWVAKFEERVCQAELVEALLKVCRSLAEGLSKYRRAVEVWAVT
jgi:hypothetical protein